MGVKFMLVRFNVHGCGLACGTPLVVMNNCLFTACNMCSVVRAARQHRLVQTRRPRVPALLPPEPEPGPY